MPFRRAIFISLFLLSGTEVIAQDMLGAVIHTGAAQDALGVFHLAQLHHARSHPRLIGQLEVHILQSAQAVASAINRREGQPKRLRIQRPMIMNGAIQQMVWQPARRPTKIASPTNKPITT